MPSNEKPTLRWGIVATGLISSWFVADLIIEREDTAPEANHIIQAVGSSSLDKGKAFVAQHLPTVSPAPTIYGSYEGVYADPNVEVVYIGTPHAFHKKNCLDAISHGKNILCEKAFTLNASETKEVLDAAKAKGVFVMEAMWTRFFPLVKTIQKLVHEEKAIGRVHRVLCDFAMDQGLESKGSESRLKNLSLGASTLLDIGIYPLTWGIIGLEQPLGGANKEASEKPKILATSKLSDGVDVATSIILQYPDGRQAITTSHSGTGMKTPPSFCRIEGSEGTIVVDGFTASVPSSFVLQKRGKEDKKFTFERPGKGFYWEADAVALDIAAGRKESERMPWAETIRVMELLDEARRQGGVSFPQDV
ncbi:NAD(P)-binding protein [Lophiostoma macrostomum CBS 122681]|uniref:D-xylose 1-dehydrogenase (NADP(+), D-xylono-1,5-lactone-forming) n=1 Tax=Lophiostoma macrostomum CBS 122681 TaxID=1314788 RepID=A0A6A6TGN6_9PLEO|nr:NAD(P)-binding protein [Lophiostoma macrostomum CBS 122681]